MRKCIPDNVDLHGYAGNHALEKSFLIEIVNQMQNMFWETH